MILLCKFSILQKLCCFLFSFVGLFQNINASHVVEAEQQKKKEQKAAHEAKVERDRKSRETQKQKAQDRKEKEKKRTQKNERKR